MSQGDNLKAAKAFSGLCDVTLSRLVESESYIVTKNEEKIYVVSALDTIKTEAGHMRAKAISRAAQTAIDGVQNLRDTKNQVRNLRDLMHLVRQYQSGLEEILPQNQISQAGQPNGNAINEFETARRTLRSVIKHAGADRDIAALSRLADWRPHQPEHITFDQLMPGLSEEILRSARACEKTVSVSYAADDIILSPRLFHNLSEDLTQIGTWLVQTAVEPPATRLAQGLGQSSHIAITARKNAARLDILLSCDGKLTNFADLGMPVLTLDRTEFKDLTCTGSTEQVRVELKGVSLSEVEPKIKSKQTVSAEKSA